MTKTLFFPLILLFIVGVKSQDGPILHKALGVAVIPASPIYPKESEWSHVIKIELPCLQDIITSADIIKINDTLYVLSDLHNVTQAIAKANKSVRQETRVNAMMMIYRSVRARIKGIYKDISQIKYKGQYLWGIFPRSVCTKQVGSILDEPYMDYEEEDVHTRYRRFVPEQAKDIINVFSFDKASGTSFTLNQYFSNRSFESSEPLNTQILQDYRSDDSRRAYHTPLVTTMPPAKILPTTVSNPTKRPRVIVSVARSVSTNQRSNQIDETYDADDDGHFSPTNTYAEDQPTTLFNKWRYACLDPIISHDGSQTSLKMCDLHRDKFGAYRDSCTTVDVDYAKFLPEPSRRKRALCSVCGQFYSWLYGVISEGDMKNMITAIKDDFSPIIKTINDGLSQQKLIAHVLNSSLIDITYQLNLIHNQTASLKDFSYHMQQNLGNISGNQEIADRFDQFIGAVTILGSFLDTISDRVVSINHWLSALKSSLQSQTIDLDLLPNFRLKKLFSSIRESLPEGMMISPPWNNLKFLTSNMASVMLSDHNLIIAVRVPLCLKSNHLHYWHIRAIPHLLNVNNIPKLNSTGVIQTATVLNIPPGTAIIDSDNSRWTYLHENNVLRCHDHVGSSCDITAVWKIIDKTECIPSLILNVTPQQAGAQCIVKLVSLHSKVEIVAIDKQHWLISSLVPSIPTYQSCARLIAKGSSTVEEKTITGLNLIEVPPNCKIQIENYILSGFRQLESEQHVHMDMIFDKDVNSSVSNDLGILIQQLNSSLAIPYLGPLDHFQPFSLNDSLFDFGTVTLENLRTKLSNFKEIKMIDKSFYNLDQFEKQYSEDPKIWDIMPQWGWWSSITTIIVGFVLLLLVRKYCLSRRAAMVGFGLQSLPLTTSSVIPSNTTNTIKTTSGIMSFWVEHRDKIGLGQLCVSFIMILLMLYCTIHLYKKLHPTLGRLLSLNQIFPQATNVFHHPGEAPVTMTILVSIKHFFHPEVRAEIGIQVATLPLPSEQWYADSSFPLSDAIYPVRLHRWSTFKAKFKWAHMCIKSNLADVETCEDMPGFVTLDWDDIMYQLSNAMKWDWKSVSLISITTLAIGQGVHRRVIKSYLNY